MTTITGWRSLAKCLNASMHIEVRHATPQRNWENGQEEQEWKKTRKKHRLGKLQERPERRKYEARSWVLGFR